jgi:hypothetical protein
MVESLGARRGILLVSGFIEVRQVIFEQNIDAYRYSEYKRSAREHRHVSIQSRFLESQGTRGKTLYESRLRASYICGIFFA